MQISRLTAAVTLAAATTVFFPSALTAQQDPLTPEQRVAALKQSLQDSQTRLRKYEWIETTIISLKGEEKARQQKRCYYGADGKVQKVPIESAAPAPKQAAPAGRRGGRVKEKIVENKKDEMKDYMEKAAALVHQYVPPVPAQIQKAKDAGKLKIKPLQPGVVQVEMTDYLLAGDRLAVDVNAAANNLSALNVSSYLDKRDDSIVLAVQFGALADGTSYTTQTTLDAAAKSIRVVIQNTGHRPVQ